MRYRPDTGAIRGHDLLEELLVPRREIQSTDSFREFFHPVDEQAASITGPADRHVLARNSRHSTRLAACHGIEADLVAEIRPDDEVAVGRNRRARLEQSDPLGSYWPWLAAFQVENIATDAVTRL